jgi:N-acetylmuramoyl-L-alanine amidase
MIYRQDHIPLSTPCNRRPGLAMTPQYITVHNTGNPSSTAANERAWLTNPSNAATASYQIVVDDTEAIECIPLSESAWHAGDGNGPGNRQSIGIEICESGDYAKALDNAAALAARLLQERGWGTDRLRRHFDWSGKICPRLMYSNGSWAGWTAFVNLVDYKQRTGSVAAEEEDTVMKMEQWQWKMLGDALDGLFMQKVLTDYQWATKAYSGTLTATELAWLNTVIYARQQGIEV